MPGKNKSLQNWLYEMIGGTNKSLYRIGQTNNWWQVKNKSQYRIGHMNNWRVTINYNKSAFYRDINLE